MEPDILVIDRAGRRAPGRVEELLAERGSSYAVAFLDQVATAAAPAEFHVGPGRPAELRLRDGRSGETVSTRRLRSVWAEAMGLPRNPMTAFVGDDDMAATLRAVGEGEAWIFGLSVLAALAHGRLFLPQLVERSRANHRLYQIAAARDSGLSVPRTVVCAHPPRVIQALAPGAGERIHYQSLSQLTFTLRGRSYVSVDRFLSPERCFTLQQLRGPALFALWPPGRRRLLVAVLGDEMWSLEVGTIDPDLDPDVSDLFYQYAQRNLRCQAVDLPPDARAACRRFCARTGLAYAAFDLLEEDASPPHWCLLAAHPDGRFHLFEEAGLPVYDRLVEVLARGDLDGGRG